MSSPATVTEYGKFIDLQNYTATAPAKSGSIYLSGSDAAEKIHTNVGISAAGSVTAVGSFIIGSADMDETDLEKLDGITNGTAAANKALVLDASKDLAGLRNLDLDGDMTAATVTMTGFTVDADGDVALKSLLVDDSSTIGCDSDTDLMTLSAGALNVAGTLSCDTSFTLDSVTLNATEVGFIDGVTAGTAAASKALVLDASKNIATIGTVGCGAITSTGASTMGSLSVGAISGSSTLYAAGAATFSQTVAASGSITAGSSFIIGSADLNETDLEKLDGITNGTVAANKAVVADANKDADGFRNVTMTGDMTAGTITMTGFTVDADGDTALKSLAVDDGSTIGCDSDTDLMSLADGALTVNGTLSADTSFTLDAVSVNATELGFIDGVTAGTAAASKALVLDASKNIGSVNQLTASHIKVDTLDVNTINSVTQTEATLEVLDKKVVTSLSASSANSNAGGFQIGGGADSDGHAAMKWSHGDSALAMSIGSDDVAFFHAGGFDPGQGNSLDLGGSGNQWRNLYIDGQAFIDQLGEALDANSQNITGVGTFSAGGATVTSLSVSDGNVTNVADIALDSISADGADIDLNLPDNQAAALDIKEGSTSYMKFVTTNGQEYINVGKQAAFGSGASVDDDQVLCLGSSGTETSLKYISAQDLLEVSGTANGIRVSGSLSLTGGGGDTYGIEAGDASFAATTVTSLSVSDGSITNVARISLDSIAADANDIDFVLTDNRASALDIKEGSTSYLKFVTTDGQEEITAGKELVMSQGGLVADDQAMVFGDDDDGSISFVSAANVVRFDGGSAGLHFNDTSVFGADGSGKDVSFHGAAANELMKYTAADHTLKFTDSSGAAHVTIGGDATSEFAVDVADGSNNKNKVRAAAFVTYSDERLKTDVSPIQGGLETVNNLKAVNFTWKKDGSRDFGFMAQELKQVVPQAVHGSEEGLYGVDYGRLSAILVSAIQEQSAQIASLKKQLENK